MDHRTDGSRVSEDSDDVGRPRGEHWNSRHPSSSGMALSDIESVLSE